MSREYLLATHPKRENFETDEDFEEALGRWQENQGRILGLTNSATQPERRPTRVPIKFFTVLAKVESIPADMLQQRDSRESLASYVFMSAGDAEALIGSLIDRGLVVGEHIGLADMMHGPMIECEGIRYERSGDEFVPSWTALRD